MNNAEWCIKNNIRFKDLRNEPCFDSQFESIGYYGISGQYHECYKGKVLGNTVAASILTWLDMEHKDPILDDAERKYLSAFIKPFRERVVYLKKYKGALNFGAKYECIDGQVRSEWDKNLIFGFSFPPFRAETMYKGMEPDKKYTLEELGL